MTVITEAELREMWQNGRGTISPLPRDVRFTPAAKDFINQWSINITFEDEIAPPAVVSSPMPSLFRGKMDTLHAQVLLAIAQARRYNFPQLAAHLETLATHCQEIAAAEIHKQTVSPLSMGGKTAAEIHDVVHHPQKHLGIEHIVHTANAHEMLLMLNLLHAQSREAELTAVHTFTDANGQPTRPDLIQALNGFSDTIYYLELLFVAGKFPWQAPGIMAKNE